MSPKRVKKSVKTATDHDGETRLSPAGQICCLSPSWYHITGFNPEDILKDPLLIARIVHPDDLHLFKTHLVESGEKHLPGQVEFRVIRPDGEVRWVGHSCVPVFDESGQYAGARGDHRDITERREADEILKAQRDLGEALVKSLSLNEALQLCLKAAVKVSGLDAGGIFIRDEATGDLNLFFAEGFGDEYVRNNSHYSANSRAAKVVAAGNPFYLNRQLILSLQDSDLIEERMRSIAIIPFFDKGKIIGSLHLISCIHNEMPDRSRFALEAIARYIGAAIARAQAAQSLRISEEKYRALFENAVIGIFQTAPDGKILSANPAMAGIFGYDSLSDFLQDVTNITQLYVNPDDRLSILNEIGNKGPVYKYEVPCIRKDGREILVAISARAHRDQNGHVISYHGFFEDVTQPKKMEAALRKSEEQFRAIFEMASIGMAQADIETGQWLRVNQKMCDITGYSSDEMLALRVPEITHPEDRDQDWKAFQNVVSGKQPNYRIEKRYIRKDGSIVWVNVNMTVIRDSAGRPICTVATIEDITGRKRTEAELERSRDFIENIEDACFELDLSGNLIFCNQSFLKTTGYTFDEYKALSRFDLHPTPDDAKRVYNIYKDVYRTGIPVKSVEYKSPRKDGTITNAEVSISLVRDKSGNPVGFRGVGRDISDRKRAESQREAALEALRESEEKFRVLADSTPTAVMLYQDDRWVYANKATETICGYSEEELRPMNFWDIVHPEFKQIVQREGRKRQQGEKTTDRHELKIITKDGREKWVDISGASTMLHGRLAGILSILDVTERKKAEEGLREAHRRLDEIIEYLPDATLVIDAEGKVIAWNRAIEQMTGIKAADMLGKGNYEYTLPFYGERRPMLIDLVLAPREDVEAEYLSTKRRDTVLEGEVYTPTLRIGEVYLFGRASALQDSKGNIVGAIESIRDITARKQAEEKYRALFENAVEGIFQTTPEGNILNVNPAMVTLGGYDSPEDLMRNVKNIIQFYANPDDRLSFRKEIEEKGIVNKYEVLCIRKDGRQAWISVNARAVKDRQGQILHYEGFFEDITERKKMEDTLLKSEERYRMIVENTNDVIWIMDLNFQYKYRSPANVQITGRTSEEIMGIPPREQVVPESYALVEKILAEELAKEFGGKPVDLHRSRTIELEVYHKNGGTVWIEVTGSFGRDKNGKPVEILLVGREVTERKKIQEALKESEKRYRMIVENMNDTI